MCRSGPLGPVWPGGAVTDIGSVCASRDLRLESKPQHRVIFGSSKGFVIMFCRFLDILPPNLRFFGFPLKMGLSKDDPMVGLRFKPQATSRTHGANIGHGPRGPNGPKGPKRHFFNGTRKIENLEVTYQQNDETCLKTLWRSQRGPYGGA